jgi:magnesium-transporting ATPase (P-type)
MVRIGQLNANKNWHMMSVDELSKLFYVDLSKGLPTTLATFLNRKHGLNSIRVSNWRLLTPIVNDLTDSFSLLLWLALILNVLLYVPFGNPPLIFDLVTAFILFLNITTKAALNALREYQSIRAIQRVQYESIVSVMRDGKLTDISSTLLVPGDLVHLKMNKRVPAMLRLIESNGLVLDNSLLTGETETVKACVHKYNIDNRVELIEANNMAFANCLVVQGSGVGIVVRINRI